MTSNSNKNKSKLPWWVELLFVQIGLPDSWLSSILKRKKNAGKFISKNKKNLIFTLLVIAAVFYLYPIVKYTSSSSSCIDKTTKYLKSKTTSEKNDYIDMNSIAVGYCHGGNLPE